MIKRLGAFGLLALLPFGLVPAASSQEAPEIPFHLPLPEGWRAETIPFPLEFAPTREH